VAHGFEPCVAEGLDDRRSPGPMRIVYTGRFYHGVRTPLGLFRALADLNMREPLAGVVDVLLMGPHIDEFRADARRLGLAEIVRVEGRHPRADANRAAAQADVLLVVDAASEGDSVFLPSKLVEYLAFRKPVLGLTPPAGASARLLARLGCP